MLTRLIDLRYVSAFLAKRAAYSFFGAVLCCCGSLAFYRADIVRANLDDFLDQRFLGRVATYGDDRRLTNYALRGGRVVLCPTAGINRRTRANRSLSAPTGPLEQELRA